MARITYSSVQTKLSNYWLGPSRDMTVDCNQDMMATNVWINWLDKRQKTNGATTALFHQTRITEWEQWSRHEKSGKSSRVKNYLRMRVRKFIALLTGQCHLRLAIFKVADYIDGVVREQDDRLRVLLDCETMISCRLLTMAFMDFFFDDSRLSTVLPWQFPIVSVFPSCDPILDRNFFIFPFKIPDSQLF